MNTTIYFDMDGTIADLYGVDDWLNKLRAEDESPYEEAGPLADMTALQDIILSLQNKGYKVGIITWLAKDSTKEYEERVANAKRVWLKLQLPKVEFDEMHILPYGTRKDKIATEKSGLIFDDDKRVRDTWKGRALDPSESDIVRILESIHSGEIWVRPHYRSGNSVRGYFRRKHG